MLFYFLSHLSCTREIRSLQFICHKEYLSLIIFGQWPLHDAFQWLVMGLYPCKELRLNDKTVPCWKASNQHLFFYPNLFFSVPFRTLMTKLVLLEVCSQVSFRCIILLVQLPHNFWIILLGFVYYWKRCSWVSIVPSCNVSRAEHNRIWEIPVKPKICQIFLIATLGLSCILI